jgi:hypothetical protein
MEDGFINILGADEIDTLFGSEESTEQETQEEGGQETNTSENQEENGETTTTEVKGSLFEEEDTKQPESVGSEDNQEGEKEGSTDDNGGGTSPNDNFYSSIANAMAEDGIFPNLDEEMISKADSAEALSDLIEAEVNARLDEKQQRVSKALENGVEATDIRKYENTLNYISSITDALLMEEGDKGEQLRRNIIFQDYLNKGYSQERAQKLTERSIDAGTDIEDAKGTVFRKRMLVLRSSDDALFERNQGRSGRYSCLQTELSFGKTSDKGFQG